MYAYTYVSQKICVYTRFNQLKSGPWRSYDKFCPVSCRQSAVNLKCDPSFSIMIISEIMFYRIN